MSKTIKVTSPYDQRLIKELPLTDGEALEKKIVTAFNLFTDTSQWIPAHKRIAI